MKIQFFHNIKERNLSKDNRGSGLIVVMLAVFFVLLLASSILYASYNVFLVRSSEQRSQSNFTSADAGMEEIRTGLQDVVSYAANQGYNKVLKEFNTAGYTKTFRDGYIAGLDSWQSEDHRKILYFTGANENRVASTYDLETLASFLENPPAGCSAKLAYAGTEIQGSTGVILHHNGTVTKDGDAGDTRGKATQDPVTGMITFKGISLTYYNDLQGYQTNITTDIEVNAPEAPVNAVDNGGDINDYCIVADQGIVCNDRSGRMEVSGDIYAGKLTLTNGARVTLDAGKKMYVGQTKIYDDNGVATDQLTSGDIEVDGGVAAGNNDEFGFGLIGDNDLTKSHISFGDNTQLWAHNVDINGGILTMSAAGGTSSSQVNVANDLSIGRYSEVKLAGDYFGFGDDLNPGSGSKSSGSSSILFSSLGASNSFGKSKLDFTDLNNLSLAGRSYIKMSNDPNDTNEIPMGSSVSSKADQLAYLIPADLVSGGQNPVTVSYTEDAAGQVASVNGQTFDQYRQSLSNIDFNAQILPGKTLASYGIDGQDNIKVLSYQNKGAKTYTSYVFMNFTDRNQANQYFQDFFAQNDQNNISSYLEMYADLTGKAGTYRGNGVGLGQDEENNKLATSPAYADNEQILANMTETCRKKQVTYDSYSRRDYTEEQDGAVSDTPFRYYINLDVLDRLLDPNNTDPVKWTDDAGTEHTITSASNLDAEVYYDPATGKQYQETGAPFYVGFTELKYKNHIYYRELKFMPHIEGVNEGAKYMTFARVTDEGKRLGVRVNPDTLGVDKNTHPIIIADGDVEIHSDFPGANLIMCTGTLYHTSSAMGLGNLLTTETSAYQMDAADALSRFGHGIYHRAAKKKTSEKSWSVPDFVNFSSWKKNVNE